VDGPVEITLKNPKQREQRGTVTRNLHACPDFALSPPERVFPLTGLELAHFTWAVTIPPCIASSKYGAMYGQQLAM
jgi:hypothetical protein